MELKRRGFFASFARCENRRYRQRHRRLYQAAKVT